MSQKDTYNTITKTNEGEVFKDKNSKFYGYVFPVQNENQVKLELETLKKSHHAARHWCYAYQLGTEKVRYRVNDDGEPNNSAGAPIYGQIQSYGVTNVLVVVVRYFGGIKLGVSGLINAYRTSAQLALKAAYIVEKTIDHHFQLEFEYKDMSKVMHILKKNSANITNQKLEMTCLFEISVRKSNASALFEIFKGFHGVTIKDI